MLKKYPYLTMHEKTRHPGNVTAVKDMIKVTKNGSTNSITVANAYTAGKLTNGKDITDANITAMLEELKAVFPHGTSWGDGTNGSAKYYYGSKTPAPAGGGCNAWAGMVGDTIFGKGVNWKSSTDFSKVKAGDLIEFKDENGTSRHWIVVMEQGMDMTMLSPSGGLMSYSGNCIKACDGNSNAEVHWDWVESIENILYIYPKSVLYTAY